MYNVVQEPGVSFLKGLGTFLFVFFVAIAVGVVIGLITLLISRFTHKFRDAEPVVGIAMGYLSYLMAEYFGLSGIVSMTIYGLIYSEYINYNFKKKSNITIAKTVKTLAGISETMIFFLLGVVFFVIDYQWDTGFVFWSLLFCFLCRFLGMCYSLSMISTNT
jgi:NhaP-type Na+/H+ or K+/H+ antiporter